MKKIPGIDDKELGEMNELLVSDIGLLVEEYKNHFAGLSVESRTIMAVEMKAVEMSLSGDPSFTEWVAKKAREDVVLREVIPWSTRIWLAMILTRLLKSDDMLRAASGSQGKGRPMNRKKGFDVAISVMDARLAGSQNFEDAWAVAAKKHHLGESRVKQMWTEWRPALEEMMNEAFAEESGAHLDDVLANSKKPVSTTK